MPHFGLESLIWVISGRQGSWTSLPNWARSRVPRAVSVLVFFPPFMTWHPYPDQIQFQWQCPVCPLPVSLSDGGLLLAVVGGDWQGPSRYGAGHGVWAPHVSLDCPGVS